MVDVKKAGIIEYRGLRKNKIYEQIVNNAIETCFEIENIKDKNLSLNVILTVPEEIRKINKEFRNIDKETDVLSFPMFEKKEIAKIKRSGNAIPEILGDIIISIEQVKIQAEEYGHGFERELAYMVVHGFYHCMGYDHIKETDKKIMRKKEETALKKMGLERILEK